jgi:hypothetical protein
LTKGVIYVSLFGFQSNIKMEKKIKRNKGWLWYGAEVMSDMENRGCRETVGALVRAKIKIEGRELNLERREAHHW